MKVDTWMPVYVPDLIADTMHLSALQFGAYLLLLFHYWRKGPPPNDDVTLSQITRLNGSWAEHRAVLAAFFDLESSPGFWVHGRVERELANAQVKRQASSEKGKKGALARWSGNGIGIGEGIAQGVLDGMPADAPSPLPTPLPTPTEPKKDSVGQTPKPRLSDCAKRVLDFLNEKTGRRYQPVDANLRIIAARLRDGATEAEMRQVVAKKCREWANDETMAQYLRPATLFNATKFAQYQGELVVGEVRNG